MIIKKDFKIEIKNNGSPVGYPYLFWLYNGLRFEGLIDTGADNNVFKLDFLKLLEAEGKINIEEIYRTNKVKTSGGLGGNMLLTELIPIRIQLDTDSSDIFLDLQIQCCLPKNKDEYDGYLEKESKAPTIEQQFQSTNDTRLKQKLYNEIIHIQELKRKFNPPFLLGKPFLSQLKNINFVIEGPSAEKGSYFEFEVRPEFIKKQK